MAMARVTPHQKEALLGVCRRAQVGGERPGDFVPAAAIGSPAALEHLFDKRYLDRVTDHGPRGGARYRYRPTTEGYAIFDAHVAKLATAAEAREMPLDQIDTMLIRARDKSEPVCVYVSPTVYYRGIPGVARRTAAGKLVIPIGFRQVPMMKITKVTAGV